MFGEREGIAQPAIMFSNPASFDITVDVETNDITATGVNTTECSVSRSDNDYTTGMYRVTIPANVTLQLMNISICNDVTLEMNEEFSATIVNNSHPDNVTIGSPNQTTITILDNNRKFFEI